MPSATSLVEFISFGWDLLDTQDQNSYTSFTKNKLSSNDREHPAASSFFQWIYCSFLASTMASAVFSGFLYDASELFKVSPLAK